MTGHTPPEGSSRRGNKRTDDSSSSGKKTSQKKAGQKKASQKKTGPGRKKAGSHKDHKQKARNQKAHNQKARPKVSPARSASLAALKQVFDGRSLSSVQRRVLDELDDSRDRALANEIVNGVLRWRWQLAFFVAQLLSKPLKAKDLDVQLILLQGLYELQECRTPDYAIINESVELVRKTGKRWAASLVNAVLRRFTREQDALVAAIEQDTVRYSHPAWLLDKVRQDWPDHWQSVLEANNQRPAFWLRVNRMRYSAEQYLTMLAQAGIDASMSSISASAIKLDSGIDVRQLPGFAEGAVSVQDVGAQLAADLLPVADGQRVLDLCAAPGGKTCHLLESGSAAGASLQYLAVVELESQRMSRVQENLQRLGFIDDARVECITADARDYRQWWRGKSFDRILIDAPCSASGVIRRHPDIKSLRRQSDIAQLVELQAEILSAAWHMLAPGGELLYVTCSVFRDENQRQIERFMTLNSDAAEMKIEADWGQPCDFGRQLLPGEQQADGFYFCHLRKIAREKPEV